jgi:hypothetical protein
VLTLFPATRNLFPVRFLAARIPDLGEEWALGIVEVDQRGVEAGRKVVIVLSTGPRNIFFFVFQIPANTTTMEQHALKIVNNCLNTSIYSYLETSGGQSSNLYLDVVHFFNNSVY